MVFSIGVHDGVFEMGGHPHGSFSGVHGRHVSALPVHLGEMVGRRLTPWLLLPPPPCLFSFVIFCTHIPGLVLAGSSMFIDLLFDARSA
jgi:hypothetical protein